MTDDRLSAIATQLLTCEIPVCDDGSMGELRAAAVELLEEVQRHRKGEVAIPMLLWCPACRARHVDAGEYETKLHHAHACQACGMVWRPAVVPTVGVQFLPGFRDEDR